jgi:hypothetical protein
MSNDNTRDGAEPSPASAGSIASPRNRLRRCHDDPPLHGVYVLAFWRARGDEKETMSARVATMSVRVASRGVPAWYARNGVELVPPDFWMPMPEDCGQ